METKNRDTEINEIKGTPFHLIKHNFEEEGEKYFVALGMSRVSPLYETKQQAEIFATKNNNWELLIPVIATIAERVVTDLKIKKN